MVEKADRTLNVPILYQNPAGSARVVVVSETAAQRFWAKTDPIGQRLRAERADYEVIGVVEDAPIGWLHEDAEPYLYFAFSQVPAGELTFLIETAGKPSAVADSAKPAVD